MEVHIFRANQECQAPTAIAPFCGQTAPEPEMKRGGREAVAGGEMCARSCGFPYSLRNAISGSTRNVRRAGI